MPHIVFSSHDGFGLGHVRRNALIATALLHAQPDAEVTIVTGITARPAWLEHPRISVVQVPPLLKDHDGAYRNPGISFEQAIGTRERIFRGVVESTRPAAVVVDRHPYGTAGELFAGLCTARDMGATTVLGLRDVIDEPSAVRAELAGAGWRSLEAMYDAVLVYGEKVLCDHETEYGLPHRPEYCGWVCPPARQNAPTPGMLVVTAGGGGDGETVYRLGAEVLRHRPSWVGTTLAGPYAADLPPELRHTPRLRIIHQVTDSVDLVSRAAATVQMAGYNSTAEALACGIRPILVPRRSPRREQAIRALRLTALGLADTVDEQADASEVAWLLDRPRRLPHGALEAAGIRLDGARTAALRVLELARTAVA